MIMKLNPILYHMLSTSFLFSTLSIHAAVYSGESYGLTALTLESDKVESCTPDIDPITRQITTLIFKVLYHLFVHIKRIYN